MSANHHSIESAHYRSSQQSSPLTCIKKLQIRKLKTPVFKDLKDIFNMKPSGNKGTISEAHFRKSALAESIDAMQDENRTPLR